MPIGQAFIWRALQLFAVVLAGATLAGCVQHTGAERSASLAVSRQAPAVPQRQVASVTHRRFAAVPKKYKQAAAKPAAQRDTSVGVASFYKLQNSKTASGEMFDPGELTAAHRTLPFGTRLRVTNVATGRAVTVRINDRGPFIRGRVVDVSHSAAEVLGMVGGGIAKVKLDVVEKP
jgi:peptidoglycan lytic transglycosylase